MKKKNYENYKNLNKTMNIKIITAFILGAVISIASSYALAETLIKSADVSYVDNSKLGATNVQAAIDGTCTKFSNDLATLQTTIINKIYPVGSIYISYSSTNPSSFLGGTWEAFGKGQTLVGIDTSSTEFKTLGQTGGSKTISYTPSGSIGSTGLTINQIPSHSHSYDKVNANTGSHTLTVAEMPIHDHQVKFHVNGDGSFQVANPGTGFFGAYPTNTDAHYSAIDSRSGTSGGSQGHTHPISTTSTSTGAAGKGTTSDGHTHTFTGTAATLNNLQPYITVYMWKRSK